MDIPYEKNAEGKYAAPENVSVYDVIERLVRFSNEYKQNNEIYGMNIDCVIDEDLKNAIIPVVLYDNTKSVWDTLQAVANFAQCYIYAGQAGGDVRYTVYVICVSSYCDGRRVYKSEELILVQYTAAKQVHSEPRYYALQ